MWCQPIRELAPAAVCRFAAAKLAAPDWAKDPYLSMYPTMLHVALLLAEYAPAALADGSDARLLRIMEFALLMTMAKLPAGAMASTLDGDAKRRLMEDARLLESAVKALASLGKVRLGRHEKQSPACM